MVDDDDVPHTIPEDEPALPEPSDDAAREPLADTSFCPECGTENPPSAANCQRCGRVLDPLAEVVRASGPRRKLRGEVAATVAGICVALVVIAWLSDLSLQLSSRTVMRLEGDRLVETRVLFSSAGLARVFGIAAGFGLAGLVAALVFAGRYLREVVLGATAGMMVQFLLWLYMARAASAQLRGDLWIVGEGFVMRGPAPILIGQLLLLMLFTALLFAFAGWVIREQISGKATCVHCHTPYLLHPRPPVRCPKCDVEQDRDGVQWPYVMAVSLATSILFALTVVLLREPLGFALECHGSGISEACMKARSNDDYSIFITAMSREQFTFWAIDQWRYLEVTAVLMLIAPLVLTFVVKRGSRASAGALVPINWLAASFVVMIVLADLGGSEAGFVFLMRMQVLALFVWTAAGVIGVLIGDKLRFRKGSAYLDEIDDG
ncbi:MAG: zinc ribbon domain-containing protein [Enhygromyxa sp.]